MNLNNIFSTNENSKNILDDSQAPKPPMLIREGFDNTAYIYYSVIPAETDSV